MSKINTTLDDVFRSTPLGDVRSAIGTTFYGINHRQMPNPVPINTDGYGLTFFTRPQLNFSTANLRAHRKFIPLLTTQHASIQSIIRSTLDPRLAWTGADGVQCPFVDKEMAFIPLMTNHLLSASGWPDPTLDTFTSKPGAYKEVYGLTDSSVDIYSAYDITATFRNMMGDPITRLIEYWNMYQSYVFQGIFLPYPDFLIKKEIDYNTRIFRLVLDRTKRYVQKIAATIAHPIAVNLGSAFNFEADKPLNESAERVDVQFRCYGAVYNDPILVHQFNRIVGIFCPSMRPPQGSTLPGTTMQSIPMESLTYFNSRGYPFIHPDTMELLWYVSKEEYKAVNESLGFYNDEIAMTTTAPSDETVSFTRSI